MTNDKMPDVIKYLLGEGSLEGFCFPDFPDNGEKYKKRYWWRKHLREAWAARTDLCARPEKNSPQTTSAAQVATCAEAGAPAVPVDVQDGGANKDEALRVALEALKSAREELYGCHSHCDPETSNDSDAVAYRDCKEAIAQIEAVLRGDISQNQGKDI